MTIESKILGLDIGNLGLKLINLTKNLSDEDPYIAQLNYMLNLLENIKISKLDYRIDMKFVKSKFDMSLIYPKFTISIDDMSIELCMDEIYIYDKAGICIYNEQFHYLNKNEYNKINLEISNFIKNI